jgi:hypothetical protein
MPPGGLERAPQLTQAYPHHTRAIQVGGVPASLPAPGCAELGPFGSISGGLPSRDGPDGHSRGCQDQLLGKAEIGGLPRWLELSKSTSDRWSITIATV